MMEDRLHGEYARFMLYYSCGLYSFLCILGRVSCIGHLCHFDYCKIKKLKKVYLLWRPMKIVEKK